MDERLGRSFEYGLDAEKAGTRVTPAVSRTQLHAVLDICVFADAFGVQFVPPLVVSTSQRAVLANSTDEALLLTHEQLA